VYNTDNPHQPAEILHPAVAQMHFSIHVRQQCTDRAAIDPGHFPQNIPIHLLKPQAGGKAIQAYGSGQWPGQAHIELTDKRIDPHILE
jgi:hypothetical protein